MPNLKITAMPSLGGNQVPTDLVTAVDLSAAPVNQNVKSTLNDLFATITKNITDRAIRFQAPGSAPAVSLAAQGSIYYDGSNFQISANGGAYAPLLSLSPQADHAVLIGPTSGGPSVPTWRGLALSDLPAIATNRLLGRVSPGSGDVEEITPGAGVLTWLQTPTSDNLRLAVATTSTGSGALVFGTSPTITNTLKLEGTIEAGATTATISPQIRFVGLSAGPFHSLEIRNATTGGLPLITVNSPSSNYGLSLAAKGSEAVTITGTALRVLNSATTSGGIIEARGGSAAFGGGSLRMYERTSNGTNFWAWRAPDNITVSVEQELPDGYGITGQALLTDGAGVMAWGNVQTFKNLLINGNMQIAQRGSTVTALGPTNAGSGYHTADRWRIEIDQLGANGQYTQSVASGAGDYPPDTVFRKSLKMTCTQAVSSPLAAAAQLRIEQRIESQNLAQVEIGNATAKQLTLSFWVKSNKTGLFVAELIDPNGTEQVSGTFTIAAANTWERHVITFPANPTGTIIANNNSYGLAVSFWLVAGSNFTSGTLQTAWGNTAANRAAGFTAAAQIIALNDYIQITGTQIETGLTATEFEVLPISTVLDACQYYCQVFDATTSTRSLTIVSANTTTSAIVQLYLDRQLRTGQPSFSFSALNDFLIAAPISQSPNALTLNNATSPTTIVIVAGLAVATTAGLAAQFRYNSTLNAKITIDAEL